MHMIKTKQVFVYFFEHCISIHDDFDSDLVCSTFNGCVVAFANSMAVDNLLEGDFAKSRTFCMGDLTN
jgi:hypothetical protein